MSPQPIVPIVLNIDVNQIELHNPQEVQAWLLPQKQYFNFEIFKNNNPNSNKPTIDKIDDLIYYPTYTNHPADQAQATYEDIVEDINTFRTNFLTDVNFSVFYHVALNKVVVPPVPGTLAFQVYTSDPRVKNLPWEWMPWINSSGSTNFSFSHPERIAFMRVHSLDTAPAPPPRNLESPFRILVFNILERSSQESTSGDRAKLIELAQQYESQSPVGMHLKYVENNNDTLNELSRLLETGFDVVHIITHGPNKNARPADQFYITGYAEDGDNKDIFPSELRAQFIMNAISAPTVVLLTVCYSGAHLPNRLFPDMTSALSSTVPAVIGMQTSLDISEAHQFCKSFYEDIKDAVRDGRSLSIIQAVQKGRKILSRSNYLGKLLAGMPILYLRYRGDVLLPTQLHPKSTPQFTPIEEALDMTAFVDEQRQSISTALHYVRLAANGTGNLQQAFQRLYREIELVEAKCFTKSCDQMLSLMSTLLVTNNWYLIQNIALGRAIYNRAMNYDEIKIDDIQGQADDQLEVLKILRNVIWDATQHSNPNTNPNTWIKLRELGTRLSEHPIYAPLAHWLFEQASTQAQRMQQPHQTLRTSEANQSQPASSQFTPTLLDELLTHLRTHFKDAADLNRLAEQMSIVLDSVVPEQATQDYKVIELFWHLRSLGQLPRLVRAISEIHPDSKPAQEFLSRFQISASDTNP